ncbi:hypothetical protein GCM10028773_58370 [Spirosoma koreense]
MSKIKAILIVVFLVLVDLFMYSALGISMMAYDDNYNESKGEYWSWASMTSFDRIISISLSIWNIINVIVVVYLLYKQYKKFRNKTVI